MRMVIFRGRICECLYLAAIFLGVIAISGILQVEGASITIKNQKFYVDGEEFFVRGMVYRPMPLGIKDMDSDGWGGGGFCSAKLTMYGEWKSNCYDQDFYDGSSATPNRVPPGPSVWFSEIWKRDLPLLHNLSVNVLRVYSFNPLTSSVASKKMNSSTDFGYFGRNHIPFMDVVDSYKMKVMVPLVSSYEAFIFSTEAELKELISNIIDEVGNHSALFSYVMGSSWPLGKEVLSRLESAIQFTRSYQSSRYNQSVLITHCFSNRNVSAEDLASLSIDYVCVNDGWDGPTKIAQMYEEGENGTLVGTAKAKGWPILVGEMGVRYLNANFSAVNPSWFNSLWSAVVGGYDKGSAGAVYFEYCDNPYFSEPHLSTCGVFELQPKSNGVLSSMQPNVFWTDSIRFKPVLFEAIGNGTLNGIPINYATRNFTGYLSLVKQAGRVPSSSETVEVFIPSSMPLPAETVDEQISAAGRQVVLATSGIVSWLELPQFMTYALFWVMVASIFSGFLQ